MRRISESVGPRAGVCRVRRRAHAAETSGVVIVVALRIINTRGHAKPARYDKII